MLNIALINTGVSILLKTTSKVNTNAQLVEFGVFGEDAHGIFTHKVYAQRRAGGMGAIFRKIYDATRFADESDISSI